MVLTLIVAGLVIGTLYSMTTGSPLNWNLGDKANTSSSGSFQTTSKCIGPGATCATPQQPRLSATDMAPVVIGMTVAMLPGAILAYGLTQASLCFLALARGRYLQRKTVQRLTRFAFAGLIFVASQPISGVLGMIAATLTNEVIQALTKGDGVKVFTATSAFQGVSELLVGVYAVTLTIIALIMVRASRIAEDHAQIV